MIRAGRYLCDSDGPYRRILTTTTGIALLVHLVILIFQPFAWWRTKPEPQTGLLGVHQIRKQITPNPNPDRLPSPDSSKPSRASRREPQDSERLTSPMAGAIWLLDIEIVPEHRAVGSVNVGELIIASPRAQEAPAKNPEADDVTWEDYPVVELDENLIPRPGSATSITIEDFAILRFVIPEYPYISQNLGVEGSVLVRMLVDKDGTVAQIQLLRSEVDKFCENSTEAALSQWLFHPQRQPFVVSYVVRFEL